MKLKLNSYFYKKNSAQLFQYLQESLNEMIYSNLPGNIAAFYIYYHTTVH